MSQVAIRAALETRLAAMQPPLQPMWENSDFTPEAGVPYQQVTVLFARPDNPTTGKDFYREKGYMQVDLAWPLNTGSGDPRARGELIRDTFPRGLSLDADGVSVIVEPTPEIGTASVQDDRYVTPVRIYFYANVFTGD